MLKNIGIITAIHNINILATSERSSLISENCKFQHNVNGACHFQFCLCDQCDEPLTDKNTLNAIRNSIQRSFEFWFGLSIEELLPADTRCLNCNSGDFRKEATLIDSHFANLLQIIDNSDFKKPLGGHNSVMFVPQTSIDDTEWTKWLAEISVISAALSRSRPIKESQPFKQLMLKSLPKIDGEIQIEEAFS